MTVKIEVQARKKPKLNSFMDVADFQFILLLGLVIPFVIWWFTGVGYSKTFFFGVGYIVWMWFFKIGKPDGYWSHWLSYRLRGKLWTPYTGRSPKPLYFDLK